MNELERWDVVPKGTYQRAVAHLDCKGGRRKLPKGLEAITYGTEKPICWYCGENIPRRILDIWLLMPGSRKRI